MTTGGDSEKPPFLRYGLEVLAQFDSAEVVLDQADIQRLIGVSCSTAERCLVSLSGLGYLESETEGHYRLAGQSAGIHARRNKNPTDDATA
jgi:DNA-binding IclR family transcriptional regulator